MLSARTRIKICGITRLEDGLAAAEHGADAVGFIFWGKSERCVTPEAMAAIAHRLPAFVDAVAVFVNPDLADVEAVLRAWPAATLQFHGEEAPGFCAGFGRPWIKAVRAKPGLDLLECLLPYNEASAWMIDAFHEQIYGGTGRSFDWNLVPRDLPRPWILSGGLDADNVGEALRSMRPYGVDISSGVEVKKGVKDAAKIAAFIEGVRLADG